MGSAVTASRVVTDALYTAKANAAVNVKDYGAVGDGVTDDRPAIQAAMTAAGAADVYFPPGRYLLASATLPGDRILVTYPDQSLSGAGRFTSILKVGASFGNYKAVIGLANDSTYCGMWSKTNLGVDQNCTNGNALVVASMATYPKMVLRLGSYAAGSVVAVNSNTFFNGDSVNCAYVYGDTIDISGNHFLNQGGAIGTGSHDHSSIYTTSTVAGGTQTIVGNTMRGVKSSGGARTGVETHGGTQTVTGNVVSGFATGMNLTGVASTYPTDGISATGNTITGACIGIHLWSYYAGTLTTGTATRNVLASNNTIIIDRDAWAGISGFAAYATGVLIDSANTAPMDGVTISDNLVTYLPITSNVASDYHSSGINIDIVLTAAEVRNLRISGNTIDSPLSCGIYISGTIKRGRVVENTIVNPAQSTDATVSTVYRSGIVLNRTLEDVGLERNMLIDTRGTHYSEYHIITSGLTAATNCWTRHNVSRYTDGVTPRCAFYPTASTAGAEFFIDEVNTTGATPAFNTKVGSRITISTTGKVLVQTTATVGTAWKVTGALGATLTTTAPAAGAGSALPATPSGYATLNLNGTDQKVAYYPV